METSAGLLLKMLIYVLFDFQKCIMILNKPKIFTSIVLTIKLIVYWLLISVYVTCISEKMSKSDSIDTKLIDKKISPCKNIKIFYNFIYFVTFRLCIPHLRNSVVLLIVS